MVQTNIKIKIINENYPLILKIFDYLCLKLSYKTI